jgi:hypothetical protein
MVTIDTGVQGKPGIAVEENIHDGRESDANPVIATFRRSVFLRWLVHDSPYITMLLLALAGVIFRLPVSYWVILMPVFGFISVAAGWRHFVTRNARLELFRKLALSWCALLLAIYLLYDRGVQGVLNANANSLAMYWHSARSWPACRQVYGESARSAGSCSSPCLAWVGLTSRPYC